MEIITLKNGCRIVLEPMAWSKSAAICIFIGCGSRDEEAPYWGASHFIEHMLFKGTATRSSLDISEQMDEIGGNLNAYTTKEYTCVYSQALESHVATALDIISDMVLSPRIDDSDVQTEKSVILEEIGMYEDSLEELCVDQLYLHVYPDSALGANILGTRDSVRAMNAEQLRRHMANYYVPERIVISICGKYPRDEMLELIEKSFGALPLSNNPISYEHIGFNNGMTLKTKKSEQTHFILAMPGLRIGDPSRYAHAVFSTILGGSSSSRLYQRVREELGLAYSIYSFTGAHLEGGLFGIGAAVAHEAQEQTLLEIFGVLKQIKKGVGEKEFNRTREQFKASVVMGLESHGARVSAMGRAILLENRYVDEGSILNKLDDLTLEDVHNAANRILDFENMAVSVVGMAKEPDFYKASKYL